MDTHVFVFYVEVNVPPQCGCAMAAGPKLLNIQGVRAEGNGIEVHGSTVLVYSIVSALWNDSWIYCIAEHERKAVEI